ncbi:iron dependent repressor, metal binding and dimerization domain protein [Paludicola sp. MB14-C6]|uniref:metal-dependent transcriptional regulator n=1 Tax=Paludihabitans sp. MB14-C6 TaxID=3070656 RepID=UPI0027DD45E5|nr:iron dependent repressor, metal binding and dimerization domain protein [Paludicola sp. MB14-C6]WMJ21960.1 iron dependent repressor, metal binding and dimerization domain protein [Paludicola sp. MB14-C6]
MEPTSEFHTVRGYQLLEQNRRFLTSAMEDYLEMIYRTMQADGYVRINVLSEQLNVSPPSTTNMVQKLHQLGLINYKKYGIITLTPIGNEIGGFLLQRHTIIEQFLTNLGVENVLNETELIEHNISNNTLQKINHFNEFLTKNPSIAQSLYISLNSI